MERSQDDDTPGRDAGDETEGSKGEEVNDPLTRSDVNAPRAPFGSSPKSEG